MSKHLLAAALLAVALQASPAAAEGPAPLLPYHKPLLTYVTVAPRIALFADPRQLVITVLVDRRQVDPASVRVAIHVAPFEAGPLAVARHDFGEVAQLVFQSKLQCLVYACVPPRIQRLFRLVPGTLSYRLRSRPGRAVIRPLRLPRMLTLARVVPGAYAALLNLAPGSFYLPYTYRLVPLPVVTSRVPPPLVAGLAAAAAALFAAVAGLIALRYLRAVRPPRPAEVPQASPLERALSFLGWAGRHGDETTRRKAIERVAAELPATESDLAGAAFALAWDELPPGSGEVEQLAERVRRETGA